MTITVKQETLQRALQLTGLSELPKPLTQSNNATWIRAIVLVTKLGGIQSYCLADNNGFGLPAIKHDLGPSKCIVSIDAIYPYEKLDKRFTPDLRSDKQIVEFLSRNGHNAASIEALLSKEGKSQDDITADRAIVKSYIYNAGIQLAKKTLDEEQRCAEIKQYTKRIKNGKDSKE